MGFLDACDKYFGTKNLYEVLKISKSATDNEVKKAYRSMSLLVHPDRVPDEQKDEATEKFKVLGKVHMILSDEDRRSAYDETGFINDGEDFDFDDKDWLKYWRVLFKEITIEDIANYEKQYKGSDDELMDLKKAYKNGKGCMDFIFNHVPFTVLDDEPRIREVITKLIDAGELEPYDRFLHEDPKKKLRRKRKLEREAKEAEEVEEEMQRLNEIKLSAEKKNKKKQSAGEEDLMKALMQRKQERENMANSFFDHLEAKYSSPKGRKTKGRNVK